MKHGLWMAVALAIATGTPAQAADSDAKKGEKVFRKCKACHVADKEKNKIGPHLVGIMGRKAGVVEKYKYSKALRKKAEEGLVWDEANLSSFLKKPKKFLKGTKMAYGGLKKDKDLANLLAYFASLQVTE